jgi:hypothetical protein
MQYSFELFVGELFECQLVGILSSVFFVTEIVFELASIFQAQNESPSSFGLKSIFCICIRMI